MQACSWMLGLGVIEAEQAEQGTRAAVTAVGVRRPCVTQSPSRPASLGSSQVIPASQHSGGENSGWFGDPATEVGLS